MGGHGGAVKPTKYYSIDDIPDDIIPRFSKRDPDNDIYKTRRWVDFKKRQILYQQRDGVPSHVRTPFRRFNHYGMIASVFGLFFYNIYVFNKHQK